MKYLIDLDEILMEVFKFSNWFMNFRWLSIQIFFRVNLVGIQKPVLSYLEELV